MSDTDDKNQEKFDVFLSHNSCDKPAVKELANSLKNRDTNVWLDLWNLLPGSDWVKDLEVGIQSSASAIIAVGKDGLGPWEKMEVKAALLEFVDRDMPVIPVLLPGASAKPDLPFFLKTFTWLDLRKGTTEDHLNQLVLGIKRGKSAKQNMNPITEITDSSTSTTNAVRDWFSPQWPVTDPALFGREEELAMLDSAWTGGRLNIVTLVAAGGVGKTALVNRWLYYHMQPDNWRGAARVFAWSFYSQGSAEGRQSSADPFIDKALRWFGDETTADSATAAHDKGQRLAELVREERTLLLLDGVEPLQEPPGVAAQHPGRLKDPGLQGLLRGLALNNPGLCIVSTRVPVADLDPFAAKRGTVLSKDLDDLTPETGAAYLKSIGVTGSDGDLRDASEDFGNHALALTLLGRFLVRYRRNDVKQRDTIPDIFHDPERGGHAKRVMKWYAKQFKGTAEGQVLRILGLFDRPVEPGALEALLSGDSINGLTTRVNGISAEEQIDVLATLRNLRLVSCGDFSPSSADVVSNDNEGEPDAVLDCHPHIREYFGDRLKNEQPEAWKAAHHRLYEYYCALPDKELPDIAEEMTPLYQAVIHGCHAGRHQETMEEVYYRRIRRGNETYSIHKLGMFGADLSALAGFFAPPWHTPVRDLPESYQAFVLHEAAFDLRGLGRLAEAVAPIEAGLEMAAKQKDRMNASIYAGNLSELLVALGRVEEARERAERSVGYADDAGAANERIIERTKLAHAAHQAGRLEEAGKGLHKAEAIKKKNHNTKYTVLSSIPGYRYCDWFLAHGDAVDAQRRARQTLEQAEKEDYNLISLALDRMTLGRAELILAVTEEGGDFGEATNYLNAAVDDIRNAGHQEYLPRGLLARADYYRIVGDFNRGQQDLEEAWDIATRGGMRLHECDTHLECARLLTTMAKSNDQMDTTTLAPDSPFALFLKNDDDRDWKDRALNAARSHINAAAQLIQETGYHRRDPEIPLETARIEALAGNVDVAREQLAEARRQIDEMGCHCWDHDADEIGKQLGVTD
jgi:tetratricopeptide (TPR) repeat protein